LTTGVGGKGPWALSDYLQSAGLPVINIPTNHLNQPTLYYCTYQWQEHELDAMQARSAAAAARLRTAACTAIESALRRSASPGKAHHRPPGRWWLDDAAAAREEEQAVRAGLEAGQRRIGRLRRSLKRQVWGMDRWWW